VRRWSGASRVRPLAEVADVVVVTGGILLTPVQ
jgi:hypothetical protein